MAKKYRFALLGSPIAHSLSPKIHEIFAEGCGINIEYTKIETDIATLKETVEYLKASGYSGFNCTMPLKEEMVKYVDKKSRQCEFLGVCNTVKIEKGGAFFAHTTDGGGMLGALAHNGLEAAGKSVLVLGAGGTAKSIILSLAEAGARAVCVLNRPGENLKACMSLFLAHENVHFGAFEPEGIKKAMEEHKPDILINATRLGMSGFEQAPAFDLGYDFLDLLKGEATVADAVYEPLETALLSAAKRRGLKALDGFWMLVYQGALAFELWTDKKIPEEYIEKAHMLRHV